MNSWTKKRENLQGRFCALEYRLAGRHESSPPKGRVILIAIEAPEADLLLLIDPRWEEFVLPEDRSYLSELWADSKERVQIDPKNLFKQLITLSVGPLIVHETGTSIEHNPRLWKLASEFEEL